MIDKENYIDAKLNEWYSRGVEKVYTPELAEEMESRIKERLRERGLLEEAVDSGILNDFSVEGQHKIAKGAYSWLDESTKNMLEYMRKDMLKGSAPGVIEEYIVPCADSFVKYRKFVDNVRERAVTNFPKELTDDDLNQEFLMTYGSVEGYVKTFNELIKCSIALSEIKPDLVADKMELEILDVMLPEIVALEAKIYNGLLKSKV